MKLEQFDSVADLADSRAAAPLRQARKRRQKPATVRITQSRTVTADATTTAPAPRTFATLAEATDAYRKLRPSSKRTFGSLASAQRAYDAMAKL